MPGYPRVAPMPPTGQAPAWDDYPGPGNHQAAANPYPGPGPYAGSGSAPGPRAHAGPQAYPDRNGYGETVNGGGYAYVIRDGDEFPARQRRQEPPPGPNRPPRADQQTRPHRRAITGEQSALRPPRQERPADADAPGENHQPRATEAAFAYGPDDPAYGPPSADWQARQQAARRQEVEEERRGARGAFEPLPPDHVVPEPPPAFDDEPASGPVDDEVDIDLVGVGDGLPLDRIKDIYQTAESIGDSRLDEHFEQLLARQRQLIREYFADSDSRKPAGSGRGAADAATAPFARPRGDANLGGARRSRR